MKKIREKTIKYVSLSLALFLTLGCILPYVPPIKVKASVDNTALTVTQSSPQTATFTHNHGNNGSITTQTIQTNTSVTGATVSGKCYTTLRQHSHEGNTTAGGTCYEPVYHQHTAACTNYHQHTDACKAYQTYFGFVGTGNNITWGHWDSAQYGVRYCPYCGKEIKYIHQQVVNGVRHYSAYGGYNAEIEQMITNGDAVQTYVWYNYKTSSYVTMSDTIYGNTGICTYGCCCNGTTGGGYFSAAGTANHMPADAVMVGGTLKYWNGGYICGKTTSTVESYTCGKTTSTIDSYKLKATDPFYTSAIYANSCGIAQGGVIARAQVSANSDNLLTLTMSNVNAKASYTVTWTKPDGSTVNGGNTLQCTTTGTYTCTVNVRTTINGSVVDNDTAVFSYNAVPKATSVRFFDYYRMPEYPSNVPTSPFYTMNMTRGNVGANTRMNLYPEYTGYTFLGIYTGTDTTSTRVFNESGQYLGDDSFLPLNGGTINLYCLYAPKSITITYDTHNTNSLTDNDVGVPISGRTSTYVDTENIKTDTFTFDTINATLSNQAKVYEGYTFDGWYDSRTGSVVTQNQSMNGFMGYMGTGNKIFDANGLVVQTGKHKGVGNVLPNILKLTTDTTLYPRYVPNAYTMSYYTDKDNTQLATKTVYYNCPVEVVYYDYRDTLNKHYTSTPSSYQTYWHFTATGGSISDDRVDNGFVPEGVEYVEGYHFDGWDFADTGEKAVETYWDTPQAGYQYFNTNLAGKYNSLRSNSLWNWAYDRTLTTRYLPNKYNLHYTDRILLKDGDGNYVDPALYEELTTAWDANNNPSASEDFIETKDTEVTYDNAEVFPGTIRQYDGYTLDGYYGVLSFPYGSVAYYDRDYTINGEYIYLRDYYGAYWNGQRHTYEDKVINSFFTDLSQSPAEHLVPDSYTPGTTEVPDQVLIPRADGTDTTAPVRRTTMTKMVGKVFNADGTLVDGTWNILFDTNVYPYYTPNHYTLSINFNKEDDVSSDQRDMVYNENFGLSNADKSSLKPYRGYTFNGWYDDTLGQIFDENGNNVSGNLWKYTQDVNAKATYTANDYVVYYNTNEADTPDIPLNVTFDQNYELPQTDVDKVPSKDGYTFIGWYDVDTGEKVFNIDGTPVNNPYNFDRDITVAVRYSNNPIDIRIATETDRKVNSGVGNRSEYEYDYSTRTEDYHLPYGIITVPTKRGYDFGGYKVEPTNNGEPTMIWNADGKASEDIFKWLPTKGETVVYATSVFTPATIKGDIDAKKYDPKTDTETDNPIHIEQVYDEPYDKLPHIPEKEGYIYDGITDKDGNPIWDKDGNPVQDVWQYIDGDIDNFIIKWTPKWYILTYDNNTKEQKVYFGEDVPNLDTISKTGFKFNGYSFDYFGRETNIVDGTGKYTAGKWLYDMGESGQRIPLKDLWELETYTVTVNDGIGKPYTVSVVYGMGYTNVEVPNKTGYVFEGYYVDGEDNTEFWNNGGKPTFEKYEYTKDISVTAKYRAKVFYLHCGDTVIKVTYDDIVNGTAPIGTKDDETVGNHINHYLFGGWTYNGMLIFGGDGLSIMDRWTLDLGEDGTHIYLEELFDLEEEKIKEDDITPDENEEEPQEPTIVPAEEPVIHGSWIHTLWNTPAIKRLIIGGGITFSGLGILFIILFILSKIARIYYLTDPEEERYKHFRGFEWINTYPRHRRQDRDHKYFIELSSKHYDALEGENTYVMVKFFPIFRFFHKGKNIDIGMRNEFSEYIIEKKILL